MAVLYIVATPIGNLSDITLRALDTLKRVSLIFAEDTRVTKKLLDRYEITTPVRSYHQHSGSKGVKEVGEALKNGDVALVTDAGTPGVADPGNELVNQLVGARLIAPVQIMPIPGASAVTTAASISGFNMSQFVFFGYVPKKKGRKNFFDEVARSEVSVIMYETPHRIIKTLEELHQNVLMRESSKVRRKVVVCRELTKQFESIYRGTVEEVLEQVKKDPVKGEYVIVIESV